MSEEVKTPHEPLESQDQVEFIKPYYKVDFAKLANLIKLDLYKNNNSSQLALLNSYKKEDIVKFLQNPSYYSNELIKISNLLYNLSSQYKRVINYFTQMPKFDYIIDPYNIDIEKDSFKVEELKKEYIKNINLVETMNIKHEFSKIIKNIFREDVFYGYEYEGKNSYYIQKLPYDCCRISGIADGTYIFEFDFSIFARNEELLETTYAAKEFKEKYEKYKVDKKKYRWQEIDSDSSICIKLNEDLSYSVPFFVGVFPEVFDIQDYKALKKAKEELQNYVILVAKIPMRKDSDKANDFLLDLDTALRFGDKINNQLPDQVGFILSPYEDVTAINLNKSQANGNDTVAEAEEAFWNAAGVNQALFNSKDSNEEIVRKSIVTDESIIFGLYRQFERWLNRKLKSKNRRFNFKVKILNTTVYNENDVYKRYKEAATYGVPVKREICAVLGLSPSDIYYGTFIENKVLDLANEFIPLKSSNTMSPDRKVDDDNGGRPSKKVDEQTEIEGGDNE